MYVARVPSAVPSLSTTSSGAVSTSTTCWPPMERSTVLPLTLLTTVRPPSGRPLATRRVDCEVAATPGSWTSPSRSTSAVETLEVVTGTGPGRHRPLSRKRACAEALESPMASGSRASAGSRESVVGASLLGGASWCASASTASSSPSGRAVSREPSMLRASATARGAVAAIVPVTWATPASTAETPSCGTDRAVTRATSPVADEVAPTGTGSGSAWAAGTAVRE